MCQTVGSCSTGQRMQAVTCVRHVSGACLWLLQETHLLSPVPPLPGLLTQTSACPQSCSGGRRSAWCLQRSMTARVRPGLRLLTDIVLVPAMLQTGSGGARFTA